MTVKQSKNGYTVEVEHDMLLKCAANEDLPKKAYKVLLYLLTVASSRRFTKISQKEIAEKINIDKTAVSAGLRSLLDAGIIDRLPYSHAVIFSFMEDDEDEDEDLDGLDIQ